MKLVQNLNIQERNLSISGLEGELPYKIMGFDLLGPSISLSSFSSNSRFKKLIKKYFSEQVEQLSPLVPRLL